MFNITKQGSSLLITSNDNSQFPWKDGQMSLPMNSVVYVIDESDYIAFRSASNNDILFTALIDEIQINGTNVTKDDFILQFDNVANSAGGGGGSASAGVNSINGFQGDLTLKTVNGNSLIGAGNIEIEGGGDVDLSDYYNKSEVDTITNSLVTNVTVMGGDRIAVIQKNGNVPQEIYFPTINNQQILGVEGDITIEGGGITEETDPIFEAWKDGNAIALGGGATASGNRANAIGTESKATSLWTNAFGYQANASQTYSLALGTQAKATAINAIAIGYNTSGATSGAVVIGNAIGVGTVGETSYKTNINNVLKGDTSNYAYVLNEYGNYVRIPTEWTGTQSQYDSLGEYYGNITYNIIEG